MINYKLLNETITNTGMDKRTIADKLNLSKYKLNKILLNKRPMLIENVIGLSNVLNLTQEETRKIFFTR